MQKLIVLLFFLGSYCSFLIGQNCGIATQMGDVSNQVRFLGNIPANENMTDRARNIWDLQVFQNKIYLGYGNTVSNAGPINLFAYNPVSEMFEYETTAEAEAIERLRVFNNKLFVPNSDMKSGDLKKYLYKENGVWNEVSSSPDLAHVRDIYFFNGAYYLFGNTRCPVSKAPGCAGVIRHNAPTSSFENTLIDTLLNKTTYQNEAWNWFFGAIEYDNKLIIPNLNFTLEYNPATILKDNSFYLIDGNQISWSAFTPYNTRIRHHHFYPVDTTVTVANQSGVQTTIRPFESIEINDDLLTTYRTYSAFNDYYVNQYNNSAGLIFKDSLRSTAKFVQFADPLAIGEDLLENSGVVYALANKQLSFNSYVVYIYKSSNPSENAASWQEVLHFDSKNIARSFEYLDGKFYFGLGSNHGQSIADCGQLLSISVCNDPSCSPAGLPCDDLDPCTINDMTDGYCDCVGTYQDSDGDGICNYYENCPNQVIITTAQQFNRTYSVKDLISFDAVVNLNANLMLYSDIIDFLPGTDIILGTNLTTNTRICP